MVVWKMWKIVVLCSSCFLVGTALSSELVVADHDDLTPTRQSPQTSTGSKAAGFPQALNGLLSRGLLPLGSRKNSKHFRRRLLVSPAAAAADDDEQASLGDHHRLAFIPPSNMVVDSGSTLHYSAYDQESKGFPAAEDTSRSKDEDGGARLNLKMVIGLAIAVPALVGSLLLLCVWFTFYRGHHLAPRPPTLPGDAHTCSSNSQSNVSKVQLLGSWLSIISTSFSARHGGGRQVLWLSSACEMPLWKLQGATNNFSANNLVGEGGTSRVYRAKLDDDTFAAVKRLDDTHFDGRQTAMQFQSEVELMRQVRHPNLVSLLGFCQHGDQRLLVYELMQNGSLHDQLYGPTKGTALTWNLRIKIALESARGLEYLHEHCVPPVVHRDLKASNILLDANFNAKISDFGLATPLEGLTREESLQLVGTVGYVAPEFFETGSLTEKSDVYAFGVVLLELLTGRKPIDHSLPPEEHSLVNWTNTLLTDRKRLPHIVAPTLKSHLNLKHLHQVVAVAALCVCEEPSYRPLIADVVQSLVPLVPIELGGALKPSHAHKCCTPDLAPKRVNSRSRPSAAAEVQKT